MTTGMHNPIPPGPHTRPLMPAGLTRKASMWLVRWGNATALLRSAADSPPQEPPSVVNQIYQPKTDSGVPKASVHCPGKCQERCAHPSEPELPPQPAVGPSVVAWHARAVAATMGQCVAAVLLCVEERRRIDCMHPAIGRSCRLQSPGDRCGSSCASMPESTTRICC